ncbi:hypothetical protein GJ496_001010 [Pomphorhynchus laevis]|nr:hypothetical protein GJ496_001010 [Pomphorhynchus laevis]
MEEDVEDQTAYEFYPKQYSDCYFNYYSHCNRGDNCEFRHVDTVGKQLCIPWTVRNCFNTNCPLRHIYDERDLEPCYYETTPSGCLNSRCPYMHYATNAPPHGLPPPVNETSGSRSKRSVLIPELCYDYDGTVTLREHVDTPDVGDSNSTSSLHTGMDMNDFFSGYSEYPPYDGHFEEFIDIPEVIISIDSDEEDDSDEDNTLKRRRMQYEIESSSRQSNLAIS